MSCSKTWLISITEMESSCLVRDQLLQASRFQHPLSNLNIWVGASQDLDLDMKLALAKGAHAALMRQIKADAALLARMHVMDYSLLLGVHYPKWGQTRWYPPHTSHRVCP